jgi:predicted nuclease of predicted toxin-antitoxin system
VKFFLDENFPRKAARILEAQGFDVFDIRGTELEGANDNILFEKAQQHEAIFLTTDKDFYHTVPFFYKSHYGVIVIALSQPDSIGILKKLELALDVIKKTPIYSKCLLLKDRKIYIR